MSRTFSPSILAVMVATLATDGHSFTADQIDAALSVLVVPPNGQGSIELQHGEHYLVYDDMRGHYDDFHSCEALKDYLAESAQDKTRSGYELEDLQDNWTVHIVRRTFQPSFEQPPIKLKLE